MRQLSYSAKPEQQIYIPIPGTDLHIPAILRGEWSQPVVIMLHGLPGASHDLLEFLGAKYLAEHGLATLRVNLYDDTEGTRNLADCTLQTHADDFDTIVQYVRSQSVPCVMATGHSYGGLTILRSTTRLDGAVLWDPSHFRCNAEWDARLEAEPHIDLPGQNARLYTNGKMYINPLTMIEERKQYLSDDCQWSKKDYPVLFIAAGKGMLAPYIAEYVALANDSVDHLVIADATHCFRDSDEVLFELFDATERWFAACQQKKQ